MRTLILFASLLLLAPLGVFASELSSSSTPFVALTSIPGIENAGNAQGLPDFLNSLYRLAIGAAAVLAVLQIVRAGIMYMGGDSVTEKKEAKSLIMLSIGGLVLILSPVVVFSIINPDILSLRINKLGELADTEFAAYQQGQEIGARTQTLLWTNTSLARSAAESKCKADGGDKLEYVCKKPDGATRTLTASQTCAAGEVSTSFCYKTGVSGGGSDSETQKICEKYHRQIAPSPGSCSVLAGEDWASINSACCFDVKAGQQCCGKIKESPNEPPPTGPNVNQQLATRFYVYRPITGSSQPMGPVAAKKTEYDAYVAACTKKPGTVVEKYANSSSACTEAELAAYTGAFKGYIQCMAATISCTPK